MAITRAQQVRQMLEDGGMLVSPSKDGKRPGYRSARAQSAQGRTGGSSARERGAERSRSSNTSVSGDDRREQVSVARTQGKDAPTTEQIRRDIDRGPTEIIGGQEFSVTPRNEREREQKNFARSLDNDRKRREKRKLFKTISLRDKLMLDPTIRTLDDNLVDLGEIDDQFSTIGGIPIGFAGAFGKAFKVDPSTKYYDEDSIREIAANLSRTQRGGITATQAKTLDQIRDDIDMRDRILDPNDRVSQEEFDTYINRNKIKSPDNDGPDPMDPCKGPNPPAYCFIDPPTDPTDPSTPSTGVFAGIAPRFAGSIFDFDALRAGAMDGGIMNNNIMGGMADGNIDETGRQMYFLGKLVKKAKRAVKKVVKSPLGKAALLGGAMYFGGGGKGLANFFGKGSFNPLRMAAAATSDGPMTQLSPLGQLLSKFGMATGEDGGKLTLGGKIGLGFGLPFVLDAMGVGKDKDKGFDINEYYRTGGINIADIRNNPYNYLSAANQGSLFAADGGLMRMGYQEGGDAEPVAKKTMPLIDMDGKEKDYRETGGFVDMGRMERADDVPARLSKNEFVFTADAVRNAGEGDIDKGAEVMYNMMKNLEAGGEVSEESQGLEGARNMFQTSQRLEEVL